MKKFTLILAMLMTIDLAMAQSYDVLESFSAGNYFHVMRNVMQMHDQNILANIKLFTINNNGEIQDSYGWCLLKVSRDCSEVLDTVIIEDHTMSLSTLALPVAALLEPDPDGEGYLFARIKRDEMLPKNHLSICRFNEELAFDMENEIRVPLEDSVSIGFEYFYLDGNDIILYYPMIGPNREFVLSRFGLDGCLKHRRVIADTLCPINQPFGKIKVWNESPKEYVVNGQQLALLSGGAYEVSYHYCVLDSLFNIEEMIAYSNWPGSLMSLNASEFDDFESLNDNTFIFTTGYIRYNSTHESGTQVTRRDKSTQANLKTVLFPNEDPTGLFSNDQIIGFQKSSDGFVYVAFFNNGIIIAKMDMDLNVIWQRRCHSSTQNVFGDFVAATAPSMQALDDGGLVIGGTYPHHEDSDVFILTLSRDGTSTPETEAFLRPYLFYPNPIQDQLHLQYSPDVKPSQIELYDLQGRLVHKQAKDLESVDMQSLAPGQYLMKVTLEDGKSYTDKIVKE